jgi:vacuolar-type H+-ATPase subunit F/Vma7
MLEVEIQKLTAAIEALTAELRSAKVGNQLPTQTPTNLDKLQQDDRSYREDDAVREAMQAERTAMMERIDGVLNADHEQAKPKRGRPKKEEAVVEQTEEMAEKSPEKSPEPANISFAEITQDDVKTIAMEISRADSSARPIIMDILGKRGSKTITQLDPRFYREVHADLMALAYEIAKNGEPV